MPGTEPNDRWSFEIYMVLLQLFTAIQQSGPYLTPWAAERGMFTNRYLDRSNPFAPTGGYGPYSAQAVGDRSFVDTATGWWWDPLGSEPGDPSRRGCMRVTREGRRSYPEEWPGGDDDLFDPDAPCTAAVQRAYHR
jgi:hypothetical protein